MAKDWHIEELDQRRVCLKQRRTAKCAPQLLDTLPPEWRELLTLWANGKSKRRWETLRNTVDSKRTQLPYDLLKWLLNAGWAALVEERHPSDLNNWLPKEVELLHQSQLREALGLRDKEKEAQVWQLKLEELTETLDDSLKPALFALNDLPPHRALSRYDLVEKLQEWQAQQEFGTRRDFALFARKKTKKISDGEWDWLESILDLAEFGIKRHTPLLLIAAPLTLTVPNGQINLASGADFFALTPSTTQSATAVTGTITHWHLVENLTCFEHVARNLKADTGVIWLPGSPPTWWRESVSHLLDLAPIPALIACDPDPAGVAIALKVTELWRERGITWQPWKMSAADLASLKVRNPLTKWDKQQLTTLKQDPALPASLAELLEWMEKEGEKGEQEGLEWL